MYQLFIRYNLDLIEINPLGIRPGKVMALDGKIAVNDQSIVREHVQELKNLGITKDWLN